MRFWGMRFWPFRRKPEGNSHLLMAQQIIAGTWTFPWPSDAMSRRALFRRVFLDSAEGRKALGLIVHWSGLMARGAGTHADASGRLDSAKLHMQEGARELALRILTTIHGDDK